MNSIIKILYQNQRSRGAEGFGFVGMNAKSINTYRATKEKSIMGFLNENPYSEILFHHRNPTSTQNTLKSTHPFVINLDRKSYYFVHNGIIQNDDELQREHKNMGIAYESQEECLFNDSEALAWDFCLWLNGQQGKMQAKGAVAFMCLETDEENRAVKLYFYRNGEAPLRIYKDKTLLVISSEGSYPLVKDGCLYCWDYHESQIRKMGCLKVLCQSVYDFYPGDDRYDAGYDSGVILEDELQGLEQERDYLISAGRYEEADYIQEQITDLLYQIKGRI